MTPETTLILAWVGYAVFGIGAFSAAFVWAVRSRQFTELDRQRHIALLAGPIEEETDRAPSRADRYTWLALALLTLAVVAGAIWIGLCKAH